ncbi:squamosa promoter-binding protein isoform X1 [Spatholobus suberectus]|nr:squamosa promoter-binding protein isoform X1 [Spatholobus suberectus]
MQVTTKCRHSLELLEASTPFEDIIEVYICVRFEAKWLSFSFLLQIESTALRFSTLCAYSIWALYVRDKHYMCEICTLHGSSQQNSTAELSVSRYVDDTVVISFLLSTEIIPPCFRTMEMGIELSKIIYCNLGSSLGKLLATSNESLWRIGWVYARISCIKPLVVPTIASAQFIVKGFNLSQSSTRCVDNRRERAVSLRERFEVEAMHDLPFLQLLSVHCTNFTCYPKATKSWHMEREWKADLDSSDSDFGSTEDDLE